MNEDNVIFGILVGGVLSVLGAIGYCIRASIASNGETDYCYVQVTSPTGMAPQFMLFGHRPWREDRHLGTYANADDARVEAKMLDCPLNGRR